LEVNAQPHEPAIYAGKELGNPLIGGWVGPRAGLDILGHAARIQDTKYVCKVLIGNPEGENHLLDQSVDGMIILKQILNKHEV
jgi:hypothetical protein